MTETRGRRADAVAVRGDRIAIAGQLSSADAFAGQSVFNVTRVVSLSGGSSLEQQNWGTVRSIRLTPAGSAVGLERHGRRVALFAALTQGRALLDVRPSITGLRVRGERVAWSTNGRRRRYDTALPAGSVSLPGPIPSGHEPLIGSFIAPVTGRYSIVAAPVPDEGRYESCPYANTGLLRATGGQRMAFELRPALEAWCQTKGLKATLTLQFGRDAGPNGPLPRCAGRSTPCGGELDVGQTLLAPVGQRSRETIELGHDERVTVAARGERLTQPRALTIGPGQAVIDIRARGADAKRCERVALRSEVLIVGRDTGVADQ